jgi:hypothetical protein
VPAPNTQAMAPAHKMMPRQMHHRRAMRPMGTMQHVATQPKMGHGHHPVDATAGNRMTEELNRAELARIGGAGGAPAPQGDAPMTAPPPQH